MEEGGEDRDEAIKGKAEIKEWCQVTAKGTTDLEAKAASMNNMQEFRDLTESKPKLEKKSEVKLNKKVNVPSDPVEEACDMLAVMELGLSKEDTDAKQTIQDPNNGHTLPKGMEASIDLVDQINSLDQFICNQVRVLQQYKKTAARREGPGTSVLRASPWAWGEAQDYLLGTRE